MDRPMYMVIEGNKMYVVLRAPFANSESGVVVYDLDEQGRLVNPSSIQSTKGEVACHIMVDEGRIFCANYISGSLIRLPDMLIKHSGHSINLKRQEAPHVHFVGTVPDKRYLCVTDLGTDTITFYNWDLTVHNAVKVPDGHGVRHLAFSGNGKWLFAANELQSTVAVYEYCDGTPRLVDVCSTVPSSFQGETAVAAIRVSGEDIYVSNRGYDSIAKLRMIDDKLSLLNIYDCGGKTPRDFVFAGEDIICANQDDDCVTVMDGKTDFSVRTKIHIEYPVCVCVNKMVGSNG